MARGLRLAVELSPEWVAASLMRGSRLEGLVVESIDMDLWERAWGDRLRPLDAALKSCVQQLGAAGARCSVFHYGPDAIAEIFSSPARGAAAVQAASLALAEQSGVEARGNPIAVVPIAIDRTGAPRQSHVLMAADRNASSEMIAGWVTRAGLEVDSIAPAEAGHLSWLVRRLVKVPDESPRIFMWLGSHRSALAVGGGGRLSLVRRLDIGVETLISALSGTSLTQDESTRLTREEARQLLCTIGIPEPKSDVDVARGLRGYHILPLLQPILQKCIVELKQSIRFGLEEKDRAGARLSIVGPGASVPRLGQVMSEQTEVDLDPIAALDDEQSDLSVATIGMPETCNLLSLERAHDVSMKRIRHALWAGGIAAAVAAAALGTHAVLSAKRAGSQLQELRSGIADLDNVMNERDSGDAEIAAIERVLTAGDLALGQAPSYADFLRELTLITPEAVRLTDISYTRSIENKADPARAGNQVELRGYASAGVDGTSPDLTAFIQSLSHSPLIASVTLGATERTTLDEQESLRFTLALGLVETMGNPARQASIDGGSQP